MTQQENHKVRNLYIALGLSIVVLIADFYISLQMFSDYERNTNELSGKIDRLYAEKSQLEDRLAEYTVTEEYLQNLGATPDQARKIIKASEVHNISPKSSGD